jgi:hypothetical protein
MFLRHALSVYVLIVLFFSLGMSYLDTDDRRKNLQSESLGARVLKHRFTATSKLQSSPGSSFTCPNGTDSSCSINGSSSVSILPGQSQTFTVQLSCPVTQVYVSWSSSLGLSISVSWNNLNPVVTVYASPSASGGGSFWTQWCDNEGKYAFYETLINVTAVISGCDSTQCPSSQWCFEDSTGAANCLDYATEGQACLGITKCLPGLVCHAQICTKPRIPCLYNPASNCSITTTGSTSFIPDGQNNTFTISLPSTNSSACGPALFTSFTANYTLGVQFYYEFQMSEVQITVNDLINGSGVVTVEFCDQNSYYATQTETFYFSQ